LSPVRERHLGRPSGAGRFRLLLLLGRRFEMAEDAGPCHRGRFGRLSTSSGGLTHEGSRPTRCPLSDAPKAPPRCVSKGSGCASSFLPRSASPSSRRGYGRDLFTRRPRPWCVGSRRWLGGRRGTRLVPARRANPCAAWRTFWIAAAQSTPICFRAKSGRAHQLLSIRGH